MPTTSLVLGALFLVVLVVLIAPSLSCRGAKPRPTVPLPPAPSTPASADSSVVPEGSDIVIEATASSADGMAAIRREFFQAMALGRQATRAKSFSRAIDAFSEAIAVAPESARALAERGYAELLAGALSPARADLARASHLTGDRKLLAQVSFNLGLVEEKTGNADAARAAYSASNLLSPTAAARAKLGATPCDDVDVETPSQTDPPLASFDGSRGVIVAESWRELEDLTPDAPDSGTLTERDARDLFLHDQVPDPLPSHLVVRHNLNSARTFDMEVINILPNRTLVVFHAGVLSGRSRELSECVDDGDADAVVDGDVIHATLSTTLFAARDGSPVGDDSFFQPVDCEDAGMTVEDLFYSLRSRRLLLRAVRSSATHAEPSVGLRLDRRVVRLEGKGCDAKIALAP